MTLAAFLQAEADNRAPHNCSSLAGDWCAYVGARDVFEPWRAVTDEADIEAACHAGLLPLWEEAIGDHFPAVTDFEAGDIAVLSVHGLEAGAVFTGERWALRRKRGLTFATLPDSCVLKGWRPWAAR